MSLSREANAFIAANIAKISDIESQYSDNDDNTDAILSCKAIYRNYKTSCEKSKKLQDIAEFYTDTWFSDTKNKIASVTDISDLQDEFIKVRRFKELYSENSDTLKHKKTNKYELYAKRCIENRILFKHKCIPFIDQDYGHDAQVLRHVFYSNRFKELRALMTSIQMKYDDILESIAKRRLVEDKKRRDEDLVLLNFNPHVKPKHKKNKKKKTDSTNIYNLLRDV